MKRGILLALALTTAFAVPAFADSYAELSTDNGVVNILGCETYSNDEGDFVYIFASFENTKSESAAPYDDFYIKAYQDGIELDSGYVYSGEYEPEGYKERDTSVRPGATLSYYVIFTLDNTESPIDVEISEFWDDGAAECTLSLAGDVAKAGENEYAAETTDMIAEDMSLDENIIATLTARIDELERRVAALEAE